MDIVYEVVVSTDENFDTTVYSTTTAATPTNVSGLIANMTYYWKVVEKDIEKEVWTKYPEVWRFETTDQLYFSEFPKNTLVTEGDNVKFNVIVENGSGNYQFQWYKDGNLQNEATNKDYSINLVQTSD